MQEQRLLLLPFVSATPSSLTKLRQLPGYALVLNPYYILLQQTTNATIPCQSICSRTLCTGHWCELGGIGTSMDF